MYNSGTITLHHQNRHQVEFKCSSNPSNPPANVNVNVNVVLITSHHQVEFKCSTSPSNPPAKLKWQTARDAIIRHSPLFATKIEVNDYRNQYFFDTKLLSRLYGPGPQTSCHDTQYT